METPAIKSSAVEIVESYIGEDNEVVRLEVIHNSLIATLKSGVRFWVPNI